MCFTTFDSNPLSINDLNSYYFIDEVKILYAPNSTEGMYFMDINLCKEIYMCLLANELINVLLPLVNKSGSAVIGFPTQNDFIQYIRNTSNGYACFYDAVGKYDT